MSRAVFLDRDNTIIHNDGDLGDVDLVSLIPGAAEAMKCLQHEEFPTRICSADQRRGQYDFALLSKRNSKD